MWYKERIHFNGQIWHYLLKLKSSNTDSEIKTAHSLKATSKQSDQLLSALDVQVLVPGVCNSFSVSIAKEWIFYDRNFLFLLTESRLNYLTCGLHYMHHQPWVSQQRVVAVALNKIRLPCFFMQIVTFPKPKYDEGIDSTAATSAMPFHNSLKQGLP